MRTNPILMAIMLGAALPGGAATVYKSVDADGNVSYSDQPPKTGATVERIDIPESRPARSEEDAARLEAMREVTARMREDRLERERARAEEAARLYYPPPAPRPTESSRSDQWVPLYYPLYPRWPHHPPEVHPRPPWRPHPKPEPYTSNPFPPRTLKAR